MNLTNTKRNSIALFIAATSLLSITTADSSTVKAGEKSRRIKRWNTDMSIDADFILDKNAQKLADDGKI